MKSRILVLMVVIIMGGCAEQGTLEQTPRQESTTEFCDFDWKWYSTSSIGYFDAKSGYQFAVVTIRIVNHTSIPVSTNPFYWELEAESVLYSPHTATFDDSINSLDAEIRKNGDLTFQIVFEIPKGITRATLHYTAFSSPQFRRDESLIEDEE